MIEKVSLVILFMSVDVKNPASIGGHVLVPYPELKDLSSINKDFIFQREFVANVCINRRFTTQFSRQGLSRNIVVFLVKSSKKR